MAFDPSKPVQTRDGRPARIICTDAKGARGPIIALIADEHSETTLHYDVHGNCTIVPHRHDLINNPEKIEGWVNVYRTTVAHEGSECHGRLHKTRQDADAVAHDLTVFGEVWQRVACIKVSFTEGEGLS